MFRTILFSILASACFSHIQAQEINTRYLDSDKKTEVKKKKASFIEEQWIREDGCRIRTLKNAKNSEILSSTGVFPETQVQCGVWLHKNIKRNFDFNLEQTKEFCPSDSLLPSADKRFEDNDSLGYTAPLLEGGKTLIQNIVSNFQYPEVARQLEITGVVVLLFTITKEGGVENVRVLSSAHPILDKATAQLIYDLPIQKPAMLNGKPVEVCVRFPMRFLIQ
jgi:TonB family protein